NGYLRFPTFANCGRMWATWDDGCGGGHVEGVVGEGRAADLAERLVADNQTADDAEAVADLVEGALLAGFGALSVGDVQGGDVGRTFFADGERGADGGVHASGEGDDGLDGR